MVSFASSPSFHATSIKQEDEVKSSDESKQHAESDLFKPFKELENQYSNLFASKKISQEMPPSSLSEKKAIFVDMDECKVVSAAKQYLYTDSVATCIAICMKGKTSDGSSKLAMYHASAITHPKKALTAIFNKMTNQHKCDKKTIETYLIGGQLPGRDNLDDYPGTASIEKEFLSFKDTFNIQGVRLHTSIPEEAVGVFFDNERIYYARQTMSFL